MITTRSLLIAIALACFALVGGALYFQHVKDMLPCPLCVAQRYAFLFIGLFALIGAFVKTRMPWILLSLLSAGAGGLVVAKHLYVIANPGFTCGIDPVENFLNKLPTAKALPWLFESNGLCEGAGELIMGLSLPQWSAVGFGMAAAGLAVALVRRAK
jgi:protein dithiol:quinone oxidoreductase